MTSTPGVGQDIEDTCGKCGDTWHVVAAKVGARVAKVVCKLCGNQHNYKRAAKAAAAKKTGTRTRKTKEPELPDIPDFDPNIPPRPYSARESFTKGERVDHSKFGVGVVATAPGPGKIDVVFEDGLKVLVCAKNSTIAPRRPVQVEVPISDRPPEK